MSNLLTGLPKGEAGKNSGPVPQFCTKSDYERPKNQLSSSARVWKRSNAFRPNWELLHQAFCTFLHLWQRYIWDIELYVQKIVASEGLSLSHCLQKDQSSKPHHEALFKKINVRQGCKYSYRFRNLVPLAVTLVQCPCTL